MKPYKTLKTVLIHPKDKQEKEDLIECVYKVPCANCDKTYIGETGRKFGDGSKRPHTSGRKDNRP